MKKLLEQALRCASKCFEDESATMPIERWNESVFRFLFSREIARLKPKVKQFVECQKIDLVLHSAEDIAFVEFKFYIHNPGYCANSREMLKRRKSYPSGGNVKQFEQCIDKLRARYPDEGERVRKFVVLFYSDPTDHTGRRYSQDYGDSNALEKRYRVKVLCTTRPVCHSSQVECRGLLLDCQ